MQSAAAGPVDASLQIPAELAPAAPDTDEATMPSASDIHVELIRGGTRLSVRWPSAQAVSCAAWLFEVAAALTE